MTKIEKSKPFQDTLELSDGENQIQVNIVLDLNAAAVHYRQCQVAIVDAKKKAQEDPNSSKNLEVYEKAVMALLELLFGRENVEKMMAFYSGDWASLLVDISPYITQTIYPALEAQRKQKIAQAKKVRRNLR